MLECMWLPSLDIDCRVLSATDIESRALYESYERVRLLMLKARLVLFSSPRTRFTKTPKALCVFLPGHSIQKIVNCDAFVLAEL